MLEVLIDATIARGENDITIEIGDDTLQVTSRPGDALNINFQGQVIGKI
jgi:hypothetical protein